MAQPKTELLKGTLDLLILKILSAGPKHGYAIARTIEHLTGDALRIEEGSLYPALFRLDHRGSIKSEWGVTETKRRAKYYRLTARGRRQLESEVSNWQRVAGAVAHVLEGSPARLSASVEHGVENNG